MAAPAPNPIIVTIRAVDPPGPHVTGSLGPDLWNPDSDNGWTLEGRPRRTGYTWFDGITPYTMIGQILFDGWDVDSRTLGGFVHNEVETLRRMGRDRFPPRNEPAIVEIECLAVPANWLQWVIQKVELGDQVRDDHSGLLVRQFVTVTFLQYVGADVILSPAQAAAQRAQQSAALVGAAPAAVAAGTTSAGVATFGASSGKTYTVKAGDTLETVALRVYGTPDRWHDIARANGLRDPGALRVAQVLRLP